jgi:predicted nuclease of predicted toxin-antitoxin system
MKFITDQDVYTITINFLRSLGHDVFTAYEAGLSMADDIELLKKAQNQNRILVTRDRDFGELIFAEGLKTGVIYLRILPSTRNSVHEQLKRILTTYSEDELMKAFVVVGAGQYRIRRLFASNT